MRSRVVLAQKLRQLCSAVSNEGSKTVAGAEAAAPSQIQPELVAQRRPDNPPYIPWTPSDQLKKRKHYFKRMAFLVDTLEKEQEAELKAKKNIPEFDTGDVMKLKLRVPENLNKEVEFTGVCIAKKNKGIRSSFTMRKTWPPIFAIERTFPLYSPTILNMEVVKQRPKTYKKRKLYYLRETAKATAV